MPRRATRRKAHTKLQRWTDLIAALLARKFPVTFDELAREVPAYAAGLRPTRKNTVKRMFERDKDELKAFGVLIEVLTIEKGKSTGYRYRLDPRRFYLPYLILSREGERPAKGSRFGPLPEVAFEPAEVDALAHALKRLHSLGDPKLRDDASAALAKLGFDLPIFPAAPVDVTILSGDRVTRAIFNALTQSLRRRKFITFRYRAPASGIGTSRRVRPYGLFFIHAHWYLAAFDDDRDAVRNFRVSRMSAVKVSTSRPQMADFDIPVDFRLQQHAQSRAAWDLGDGEPMTADVQFTGSSGAARAAATIGDAVEEREQVRRFAVRRLNTFARWLLSLAGDAIPLSPPELVSAWRALAHETLKVYD